MTMLHQHQTSFNDDINQTAMDDSHLERRGLKKQQQQSEKTHLADYFATSQLSLGCLFFLTALALSYSNFKTLSI